MKGTIKQQQWAFEICEQAKEILWKKGFHGTWESLEKDFEKLPDDAVWWINSDEGNTNFRAAACAEKARQILGYEYNTPLGADY